MKRTVLVVLRLVRVENITYIRSAPWVVPFPY